MSEKVKAHISGVVFRVDVSVGEDVSAGDPVVTLESMKMEMPVETETDGRVTRILVEEGAFVDEGDVLVHIEP